MLNMEPYEVDMWPCVAKLLAQWKYMPYAQSRYGVAAATSLWLERTEKVLGNSSAQALVAMDADAPIGLGVLTPLPWDGEQIGMAAARLDCLIASGDYTRRHDILDMLIARLVTEAERQNIRHLSARIDAGNLAATHALEQAGLQMMDGLLTFALDLTTAPLPENANAQPAQERSFHLRLATAEDAERAGQLAYGAYQHDRFHADPAIAPEKADALHACWVRNACRGHAADGVILAEEGNELLGFVTCKLHRDAQAHFGAATGTIALVAVAEAARGFGIGRAMTMEALRWMRGQGVELAEVGTQISNISASRLYEQCGFRLAGSSLTFHKLLI